MYKSLCEFIELHERIKAKYSQISIPNPLEPPSTDSQSPSHIDGDGEQNGNNKTPNGTITPKNNHRESQVEVPPLLPLGLFYLYFQEPPGTRSTTESVSSSKSASSSSSRWGKKRKHTPKSVYKQIYQYHQQQIMAQKRQEAQLMEQMKQIDHIRQIQHEQQLAHHERQMKQLTTSSNVRFNVLNNFRVNVSMSLLYMMTYCVLPIL